MVEAAGRGRSAHAAGLRASYTPQGNEYRKTTMSTGHRPTTSSNPLRARRPGLRRPLAILLMALILASVASGCGGKKKEPPPPPPPEPEKPAPMLRIDVSAAGNANRGPSGQGLPVVVRLYELNAQGAFSGADFFSLYNDQAGTLGGELVASEELNLAPGGSRSLAKPLSPDARYFGAMGAFRDIDNARWRALVPLAAETDNTLKVTVGADAIRIETR